MADEASETVAQIIDQSYGGTPEQRLRAHAIWARGGVSGAARRPASRDVESVLALLQAPGGVRALGDGVAALMAYSVDVGPEPVLELIVSSPMADVLLPLSTALERLLGRKSRVPLEIEEVAQDLLEELRAAQAARDSGQG